MCVGMIFAYSIKTNNWWTVFQQDYGVPKRIKATLEQDKMRDFSEWKQIYLIQIKRFWSSHYCQNTEVTTEDKNLCKSPGKWDISLKKELENLHNTEG